MLLKGNIMHEARRPNVILILADDMGFADLGVMGSEIQTPNIDAMARNGVLLSINSGHPQVLLIPPKFWTPTSSAHPT